MADQNTVISTGTTAFGIVLFPGFVGSHWVSSANSVVIFDEIQTLPLKTTHLFCNALNFLSQHCRTTAVLCTATQPLLHQLKSPENGQLTLAEDHELAGEIEQHFIHFKRVDIHNWVKSEGWQQDELVELGLSLFHQQGSCLMVVNTRSWAQNLYQQLSQHLDRESLFHLSTHLYPAHRTQQLEVIRQRLEDKQPVFCISTQLIEAGIDISFACVVRFLAGLDSIAQAAGRCNRHAKLEDAQGRLVKGQVYIVNPVTEDLSRLPDLKVGQEVMRRMLLHKPRDWLLPQAVADYFQDYFYQRADEMVYHLEKYSGDEISLLNLLSDNRLCPGKYARPPNKVPLLRQSFKQAAEQFQVIDTGAEGVIVRHAQGIELVNELCAVAKEFDPQRYYALLQQAQQYSVNLFPHLREQLEAQGALYEIQAGHGIYYLGNEFYSDDYGVSMEPVRSSSCCV